MLEDPLLQQNTDDELSRKIRDVFQVEMSRQGGKRATIRHIQEYFVRLDKDQSSELEFDEFNDAVMVRPISSLHYHLTVLALGNIEARTPSLQEE